MQYKKLKIGIIDSGSPSSHSSNILETKDFTDTSLTADLLGHGSAVTNIISKELSTDIFCARVFHNKLVCTPSQIADAIEWLIAKGVDIINMSFGLRNDREILKSACERAINKNIILVSAAPSQGEPVFPSHYKGVIRATGDARCAPGEVSWLDSSQADFGGYSGKPNFGPAGASIGCASVTSVIAQAKIQYPLDNKQQLINRLIAKSSYQGSQRQSMIK